MEGGYAESNVMEEIEGSQWRPETATHLTSLGVKEEVRMFHCFYFLQSNSTRTTSVVKLIRFILKDTT